MWRRVNAVAESTKNRCKGTAGTCRIIPSTVSPHQPNDLHWSTTGHSDVTTVPREGLEPTLPSGKRILSPPRLPFRHLGRATTKDTEIVQEKTKAASGFEPLNRGFADPRLNLLATPPCQRTDWSGRRDSNSRLPPWQGGVLPLNYFRSGLCWCRGPESNWGHADFQSAALPSELPRQQPYCNE